MRSSLAAKRMGTRKTDGPRYGLGLTYSQSRGVMPVPFLWSQCCELVKIYKINVILLRTLGQDQQFTLVLQTLQQLRLLRRILGDRCVSSLVKTRNNFKCLCATT